MPKHDDFLDDYIAYKMCCEDNEKGESEGCYIATAVYGSYDCPELWVLRRFRDFGLRKNAVGRLFVRVYYSISPRLVKRFGHIDRVKRVCKKILDRFVACLKNQGFEDTAYYER